jgi:hypothetical protein
MCLLAAFGLIASPAFAKNKAEIIDVDVNKETKNLEVSFHIQNCFTPKMEEAIRSGVETTFKILLVVEKKGFPLFRHKLLDIALEHSIKYDRLNNEFQVMLPERPHSILVTADLNEAEQWMSKVEDVPLIPIWRLDKTTEYNLRLKAELSKVNLPLFFRYIFYFVSLWDFETNWHETTFSLE